MERERVALALTHFLLFLCGIYKVARVTRVAGSTFPLKNHPGGVARTRPVNFLIVSRSFEFE